MTERTHDEIAELLGVYALNALDPEERALVEPRLEAHVRECPRCRGELADHAAVAALLGNSGADAPPGVWDRIASALEESAPPMRLQLDPSEAGGRVVPITAARRPARRAWVAAVAAAAVLGVLGAQLVRQDDRIETLESALGEVAVVRAANVALADPAATTAQLHSADGSLQASAVLLPDGTGYLLVRDMPDLDEDHTYQLWGQTSAGLVSLGLLGADPNDVVAFHAGTEITALAVTDEQAPGVVQSVNPPVVAGRFD